EFERLSKEALSLGQEDENPAALLFFGFQFSFVATVRGQFLDAEQMMLSHAGAFPLMLDSYRSMLAVIYALSGRTVEARAEFERFAAGGFAGLRKNILWSGVATNLANVCALLGDAPRAAELYVSLAPHAGHLFAPVAACLGSVDRYLGQLAATTGRWPDAERHFQAALDVNRRMHQWPQLAFTQADYARMLIARGIPDDRQRIELLLADAWASMDRLGMGDLLAAAQIPPTTEAPAEIPGAGATSSNVCVLQREG